jgi:transposase
MAHGFRDYSPDQVYLLPPSPQDWLSEDHLAYCVLDVVEQLDLSVFLSYYSRDGRGAPAYSPRMMVGLLLYGWCHQVYSSRKIARMCVDDLGGRLIAAGHQPDFRSISDFRLHHGEALEALFLQSVHLCQRAGMVSLLHVAADGSKLMANASKHKAMSYGRMAEEEERLSAEIARMLKRGAEEDAAEDARFGRDNPGSALPDELARRQSRLAKLREAKEALEAQARAAAEQKQAEHAAKEKARLEGGGKRGGRKPADPATVKPKDKAQRNFVDPESRIMKGGDGAWVQGYNGQAVVDRDHQVIVACDLSDQAADAPHLQGMVEQAVANTDFRPDTVSADPGYFSAQNVETLEADGTTVFIPPDRLRHGTPDAPAEPLPKEALDALSTADRMRHAISTKEGRAEYAHRKKTVEPSFGQIKGSPGNPGFRQFLRRGLIKCRQDWRCVCAAHNFLKYMRVQLGLNGYDVTKTARSG